MSTRESFFAFKVDAFPWSPNMVNRITHLQSVLLPVSAWHPDHRPMGTGLPVMQRLSRRPCRGSHPALFQSRDHAPPRRHPSPRPMGHPKVPGASYICSVSKRGPAQQAAMEDVRGEVGTVEWASHPPGGVFYYLGVLGPSRTPTDGAGLTGV